MGLDFYGISRLPDFPELSGFPWNFSSSKPSIPLFSLFFLIFLLFSCYFPVIFLLFSSCNSHASFVRPCCRYVNARLFMVDSVLDSQYLLALLQNRYGFGDETVGAAVLPKISSRGVQP